MTTNFPSSLDSFTNPSATDAMDSVTVPHADQHADVNDAVEALQAKVGVDDSVIPSSLDYKVANQGLTFIKSQTIGTSVSSVTVTNAFSDDFDNYKIIYDIDSCAGTAATAWLTLGSASTGYYGRRDYTDYSTGTPQGVGYQNQSQWQLGAIRGTAGTGASGHVELWNPHKQRHTMFSAQHVYLYSAGYAEDSGGFLDDATTQFSSFTFSSSGTSISGGTIWVYGYNKG